MHHVGDEVAALREMGACLRGGGLVAIAEFGDPMRLLPAVITFGNPGLEERLQSASQSWFAAMREGLPGSVPSQDLAVMAAAAGLDVVAERLSSVRFLPPLTAPVRAFATDVLRSMRDRLATRLDDDDAAVVDALLDPDHEQGIDRRSDLFLETSRRMLLAHRPG